MTWDEKLKRLEDRRNELNDNEFLCPKCGERIKLGMSHCNKCGVEFDYVNKDKPKVFIFNKIYKKFN